MKRTFLIKKDPTNEGKDNWIVMTFNQYSEWLNTPEGQSRDITFGILNGTCEGDTDYYIECDEMTAKRWKKDQNHSDYLRKIMAESGIEIISCSVGPTVNDEELTGEELLEDTSCNVEEEALLNIQKEELRNAIAQLVPCERAVILNYYFAEKKATDSEMAKQLGKSKDQVRYLMELAIKHLQILMGEEN